MSDVLVVRYLQKRAVYHDALNMRRRHLLQSMIVVWKKLLKKARSER